MTLSFSGDDTKNLPLLVLTSGVPLEPLHWCPRRELRSTATDVWLASFLLLWPPDTVPLLYALSSKSIFCQLRSTHGRANSDVLASGDTEELFSFSFSVGRNKFTALSSRLWTEENRCGQMSYRIPPPSRRPETIHMYPRNCVRKDNGVGCVSLFTIC